MPLHEVNGVRLLVEESGSGDPLVLVHGSWVDRQTWALIEDDLARRFRVVSYDRRGHTGSEDGVEPGSRRDDEDDLAALIGTLGLAPAHVVANSFGSSISLGLAARQPHLFRTLCAHEPPLVSLAADDPAVATFGDAVSPVLELIGRGEPEDAAREFVETVLGPGAWETLPAEDRATMTANADTFAGEALDPAWADIDLDALSRTSVPVLFTQGDQSSPMFAAIIARLSAPMDSAEVRTLPGAGHIPHATQPGDYVAAVGRFAAG